MAKQNDRGDPMWSLLDNALALSRRLEEENIDAARMQMSCGDLATAAGTVPWIVQTPYPALVRPYVTTERSAFARFGKEQPWPEKERPLLTALQEAVGVPVVCLKEAFARIELQGGACVVTVGTRGQPGWTNQDQFPADAFDYLEGMAAAGGLLVEFTDPLERRFAPPAPAEEAEEPEVTWWDIRREGVAERALALMKKPRDRLILLLAIHERMEPQAISKLNLPQVREKYGRDHRPRVYLKQQLVRKKEVADALLQYRKRDREGYAFCDPQEPLFRDASKPMHRWRSARLGASEIEAVLERAAQRALKGMPPAPAAEKPPPPPPPEPVFWITAVEYRRNGGTDQAKAVVLSPRTLPDPDPAPRWRDLSAQAHAAGRRT